MSFKKKFSEGFCEINVLNVENSWGKYWIDVYIEL